MFRRMVGKGQDARQWSDAARPGSCCGGGSDFRCNEAAFAATVRIRVAGKSTEKDEYLQDVGTGTIVHSATGEAIILTCAHLFLNIAVKDAVVDVEVFEDGKAVSYPGKLVGGDHDADIALLRIRTSKIFPVATLSPKIAEATPGQPMVSFGCDEGADPTPLDMKLVDINRYDGPPMFICTTDPVRGRSGGGLFSASGQLLGVCSCADRKTKEGLYAAHGAILELVSYCELKEILKPTAASGGEDPSEMFRDQLEKPASKGAPPTPGLLMHHRRRLRSWTQKNSVTSSKSHRMHYLNILVLLRQLHQKLLGFPHSLRWHRPPPDRKSQSRLMTRFRGHRRERL